MKTFSKQMIWAVLACAGLGIAVGFAADRLPANSKPLDEVVAELEKLGYVVVEASIDDGQWEIEAKKDNAGYELVVDPATAKVVRSHHETIEWVPAEGEMQLSAVLKNLDKSLYTSILSAEYHPGRWEIEVLRGHVERELEIDAKTGNVLFDRVDD
jgi:uncharacterized membrane protein YkoI